MSMWSSLRRSRCCLLFSVLLCVVTISNVILVNLIQQQMTQRAVVSQEDALYEQVLQEVSNLPVEYLLNIKNMTTEDALYEQVLQEVGNLPVEYLRNIKNMTTYNTNASCACLPHMHDIEFSNIYWQSMTKCFTTYLFFGAYYDNRSLSTLKPSVRIISMVSQQNPKDDFCQLWFDGETNPIVSKVAEYRIMWRLAWGNFSGYQPYLITCLLPESHVATVPAAVSITRRACDNATNLLRVVHDAPREKKNFAVCVKGLDFLETTDVSVRLVEWIEVLAALGADVIYVYKLHVPPRVEQVLKHYEASGLVRVVPITLPGTQPNQPVLRRLFLAKKPNSKRLDEMIAYNDCFYRNINAVKFVVALDIDEVIMPLGNLTSWSQLLAIVQGQLDKPYASFYARHVYFMDTHMHKHTWHDHIPRHLHMLQHVYRASNYTSPNHFVKSFFSTERCLVIHNHLPVACVDALCWYPIATEHAQLQHYRQGCERSIKKEMCDDFKNNSVKDTSIWRIKDEVILRTNRVFSELGLV